MFYPVMRLGFLPQPSDPKRLVRLVGPARAKMILMGGHKVSAADAQAWGLIDQLCADPVAQAQALCSDLLGATSAHAAAIKHMIDPPRATAAQEV